MFDKSEKCFIKVKKKTFDLNEIVLDPNEVLFDQNEIGIYLNETESYAIFSGKLMYDYIKERKLRKFEVFIIFN